MLQVYAQETTVVDKKYDNCRLKLMAQRQLGQKIKDSHLKATNRDEDRPAIGAPSEENAKNNSKRGNCIRWTTKGQCSDGEACAFKHDPNKKGKGRDDLIHLLRQVRRTETRKDGKGSDDGSAIRVVKVKQTDYPVQTSKQEVAKGEIFVIIGMFPNVQNSSLQVDADSKTSVPTNTQLHMMMRRSIQHLLQFTFHRMMNDRCSRMTRPNSE